MSERESENGNEDLHKQSLDALGVFVNKYEPAKNNEVTDYFSSLEISSSIREHTGIQIELMELHQLLQQMGFEYEMQQQQFVWKCCQRN